MTNYFVPAPPVIMVRPQELTVDEGQEAVFACGVRGKPSPTVFWTIEGNHSLLLPGERFQRYEASASTEGQILLSIKVFYQYIFFNMESLLTIPRKNIALFYIYRNNL